MIGNLFSFRRDVVRLVDTKTGDTLMEWINAGKVILGPGNATISEINIDEEGKVEELLIGQTRYGKGHEPSDGHRPITTIEYKKRQ